MDDTTIMAKRDDLLRRLAEARQMQLRLEGAIAILNDLLESDEPDAPTLLREEGTG